MKCGVLQLRTMQVASACRYRRVYSPFVDRLPAPSDTRRLSILTWPISCAYAESEDDAIGVVRVVVVLVAVVVHVAEVVRAIG